MFSNGENIAISVSLSFCPQKVREVARKLGLDPPLVIQGEELREKGFGGE